MEVYMVSHIDSDGFEYWNKLTLIIFETMREAIDWVMSSKNTPMTGEYRIESTELGSGLFATVARFDSWTKQRL